MIKEIKKIIKAYKEKWFVPVLFAAFCGIIGTITIFIQNEIIFYISLYLPFLAILASGITGIIRIFMKNYKAGILQIISTGMLGLVGLFIILGIIFRLHPYDFYADSLKIPDNIEINIPKGQTFGFSDENKPEPIRIPKDKDFELYNASQPGLYNYEIWLSKIDSGKIYLKAYEITKNDGLSEGMLRMKSELIIGHSNDSLIKYETNDSFTIYEGDWGKPYAARFEVWYKANNSNEDIKLLEKNYKIEGWQR
ncbi:hypothetical protein [Aureivirga sp. CE67]|uniref:hypothetical protein n=1 Tax=Aureivirga sp. CE67 TaxID=1788983 RepID=UPI0018CAC547|nr:hypothetical protein [Aureivirga sp. CE67]